MALKCLVLCALLGAIDARMLPAREQMLALRGGGKAAPPPKPMITVPDGLSGIGGAAGVGGVLGFCAGKAAKAAAEGVAVAVGAAVVFTSLLSKAGYVTINYVKVEHDVMQLLDLNKDGKLDEKDYVFGSQKFFKLLSDNGLSTSGGFAAGFYAGFK